MKRCSICNRAYHIIPFQNGFICDNCINYIKNREYITIKDNYI